MFQGPDELKANLRKKFEEDYKNCKLSHKTCTEDFSVAFRDRKANLDDVKYSLLDLSLPVKRFFKWLLGKIVSEKKLIQKMIVKPVNECLSVRSRRLYGTNNYSSTETVPDLLTIKSETTNIYKDLFFVLFGEVV